MRSRSFVIVALLLAVLLVGAVGVYAYDHARQDEIANGVTVAGVKVGGLTGPQARAKLRHTLDRRLSQPVVVRAGDQTFRLDPEQAHLKADIGSTVQDALARSRQGNIFSRTARNLRGASLDVNLEPDVSYSNKAVSDLVDRVEGAVNTPVTEADVAWSGAGVSVQQGRPGVELRATRLRSSVEAALTARGAPHHITARVAKVKPTRSTAEVARKYPVILTLDRANFKLNLFKNLKLVKSYTVAVGQQGLETPAGLYHIQNKAVNPPWSVPNSAWAGSLAGQVIPGGSPENPLKARWMGIFDGAGIHGTDETYSLGQAASHGCVRMAIPDVIELYPQVPVGTPIYIA
jgi:lipoprotein-anchoring transpeptidase ErfK/SrfK